MAGKKLVAVIFGGPSVEHDISIITGIQVIENLDTNKYDVLPVYWSQDGKFLTSRHYDHPRQLVKAIFRDKVELVANQNEKELVTERRGIFSSAKKYRPDVIFPAMHGSLGEDGALQGLLEVLNIPYVGSNVGASFLTMDKNVFKMVMKASKINILPWQLVSAADLESLKVDFDYPVIVKPNSLGSSIGVKKCNSLAEVKEALEVVFQLDHKAIIEPFLEDMIEVNCSVLGNEEWQKVSICERPLAKGEVLNFEDKYMSGGKTKTGAKNGGMASLDRVIPADVPDKISKKVQEEARKIFKVLGCAGLVRVDFMVTKKEEIYVIEVNPIPGSMAFYLWEASGVSFPELLDKLIEIAGDNYQRRNKLIRRFETPVLKRFLED